MFSPADSRSRSRDGGHAAARSTPLRPRDLGAAHDAFPDSPSTPPPSRRFSSSPATFSPSTSWSHRSLNALRSPAVVNTIDRGETDTNHPVFVSDFPQELRIAQAERATPLRTEYSGVCGGMDQRTGLSWMLQDARLFVWSHLSSQGPENFRTLPMPPLVCTADGLNVDPKHGINWVVSIVGLQKEAQMGSTKFAEKCRAASLVACSEKTLAVVYWPDIFSEEGSIPVASLSSEDKSIAGSGRKSTSGWSGASLDSHVNSIVASAYTSSDMDGCVAIACQSSGELWRFDCSSTGISRTRIARQVDAGASPSELGKSFFVGNSSRARSIVFLNNEASSKEGWRQLLLLTATGLECWDIKLESGSQVCLAWTFDVLADLDKSQMLAGQKQVWLLDLHVDSAGKMLKLLLASYSKDRVNSSSYMQYFLATYSCQSNCVQRQGAIQVILPKARIEEEEFLYSMRIRVGGKPEGSAMILAGDGTATIAQCNARAIRLYQFDLAWDAGKVIDACVLPSPGDIEGGSWLVLTEKAGVWAIPGKAVLLCGVEPPERSLSRRGSQNEGTVREEQRRNFGDNLMMRTTNSETSGMKDRKEKSMIQMQPLHDEEAAALVGHLFQEFLTSGQTDGIIEKLQLARAFEKEGGMNVFALASRALVDTLAKHWTTGMVANVPVMAAVSSQLAEKQRRHQQFLQFLSASKCHEELQQKQRGDLHMIMEHGEKLAAMMWLRETHNTSVQARLQSSPDNGNSGELGGALWDLVQLAGETARRSNVMLMNRDKAEVFYSRVSELEDLFTCIYKHIDMIVGRDQPVHTQVERTCEISHACTKALQTAIRYRDAQQHWYPSPEGLTPWYCKPVVRSGLWKLAMLILELKEEASVLVPSMVAMLIAHLEELADILLEAYAGAITAKVEREEEYQGLQIEYWGRRDALLSAMYEYAKGMAEAATQGLECAAGEKEGLSIIKKLYPPLVSLARRHAGYQTLWDICADLNDMDCLRSLMHESMGLKEGRFSNFVFEQCHRNRQYSKLLRLGEEFKEELSTFLQSHKDLLWLHEIYMQRFTLASSTLHWLALSMEEAISASVESVQGNLKARCKFGRLKLRYRRRLLNLAKLSVLAGGGMESEDKTMRIDADIGLLSVQDEATRLGMVDDDDILTPRQLVEVCLKSESRDLVLRVFDVFALGGDIFHRSNKSLLESAWLRAADQDNWIMMKQVSERDGWSDEQHLEALQNTILYHAARRCYGEDSFCIGGSFKDVLPLLQEESEENMEFGPSLGVGSVEMVLMQHPDYPDAGQAMLTSIQMGKCTAAVYGKATSDEMEA